MNICEAVTAIVSYRKSRAASRFEDLPLDCRTLKDIGVTPLGISEAALAESNEAGGLGGGRP